MGHVYMDCPHREKLGWLEAVHLMMPSVLYNFDAATLYYKIMSDTIEAQTSTGLVPDIAPEYTVFAGGFRDSPEWGSAIVQIPAILTQLQGVPATSAMVKRGWSSMERYIHYLVGKEDPEGRLSYGLGDWCDAASSEKGCGPDGQLTKLGVTGTAMLVSDMADLATLARSVLHNDSASREWATAAETVAEHFRQSWVPFKGESMTAPAMGLALDILHDPAEKAQALESLVHLIQSGNDHQTAGDIGHRFLLLALAESNRSDVVAAITNRTDPPSYGAILASGATSLTEQWDGGGSQIHSMLGHVDEWFYRYLAGIQVVFGDGRVGYGVRVRPHIVAAVSRVSAWHDTLHGRVSVDWSYTRPNDGSTAVALQLNLTLPLNVVSEIVVPCRAPDGCVVRDRQDGRVLSQPASDSGEYTLRRRGGSVHLESRHTLPE